VKAWPHFEPPAASGAMTVFDVAIADDHAEAVRAWANQVWNAWSAHHAAVAEMVGATRVAG